MTARNFEFSKLNDIKLQFWKNNSRVRELEEYITAGAESVNIVPGKIFDMQIIRFKNNTFLNISESRHTSSVADTSDFSDT